MNAVLDLLNVNNWYLTKLVGDMPVRTRDAMAVELMFIRNLKALFAGHMPATLAAQLLCVSVEVLNGRCQFMFEMPSWDVFCADDDCT
jgi:hypothetical protein